MLITKKNQFTGIENSLEIAVTQEQLDDWKNGTLIQFAMPNISADEREFLITGMLPGEFDALFQEDEDSTLTEEEYWEDVQEDTDENNYKSDTDNVEEYIKKHGPDSENVETLYLLQEVTHCTFDVCITALVETDFNYKGAIQYLIDNSFIEDDEDDED